MRVIPDTEQYDDGFYAAIAGGSSRSAQIVVPVLHSLYNPVSVVDVGCGTGAWLREFELLGVGDLVGIDGGRDVGAHRSYRSGDLVISDLTRPLPLSRRFDLALCLEVAEHLPTSRAQSLVDELCGLSDRVVFSAAIPGQGGVGHVNEQWPSYWSTLFGARGYVTRDAVRPAIWANEDVEFWYRQNLLVYERAASNEQLGPVAATLDVVHPKLFGGALASSTEPTLRELVANFPSALRRSAAFHLGSALTRWRGSRHAG